MEVRECGHVSIEINPLQHALSEWDVQNLPYEWRVAGPCRVLEQLDAAFC